MDAGNAITLTEIASRGGTLALTAGSSVQIASQRVGEGSFTDVFVQWTGVSVGDIQATGAVRLAATGNGITAGRITGGDISLRAASGLNIDAAAASGDLTLSSGSDGLRTGRTGLSPRLTASGNITATIGGTLSSACDIIAGGSVAIDAPGTALRAATLVAGDDIRFAGRFLWAGSIQARGTASTDAGEAGANIRITADDGIRGDDVDAAGGVSLISSGGAIDATGSITGGSIALRSISPIGVTIGGTGDAGGYDLSASEFGRVHAGSLSLVSAAGTSAEPTLTIRELGVTGSAAGRDGNGDAIGTVSGNSAQLSFSSAGAIDVRGNVLVSRARDSDRVSLTAARQIRLILPEGSLRIVGEETPLAGRMRSTQLSSIMTNMSQVWAMT